jgi:outer membrane receptor protein involved in Fe transport
MKFFTKAGIMIAAMLVCFSADLVAQTRVTTGQPHDFVGSVVSVEGGVESPVPYAVVSLPEISMSAATDRDGMFSMASIPPGTYKVVISSLGYEPLEVVEDLTGPKSGVKYRMIALNFYMDDVVVTARASKSGASTATSISKTALDHMQATSLADVSRLLPGAGVPSSDEMGLKVASGLQIRGGQSLGAGIIVDGAPLSNNANLQVLSTARGTEGALGGSNVLATPTSGVDLRSTTTTNIESIEVIRGIPSVQYGDVASGVMIVNSKAGLSPLNIEGSINPNIIMFKIDQGFSLDNNSTSRASALAGSFNRTKTRGAINYGADYTFGHRNPSQPFHYYHRGTGRVGYTNTFGKLYTNSSVSMTYQKDRHDAHPLDKTSFMKRSQQELITRINTNGTLAIDLGWFKNIRYAMSYSYGDKNSSYQDKVDNSDWTYTNSMTDGTVLSSRPGHQVFDVDGNLVTKVPSGEKDLIGYRLPYSYDEKYNIFSKEHNTFAQVMANFAGRLGATNHRIIVGADWRNTGNTGKGKVFDPYAPPRRNTSTQFHTHRERPFNEIPFMNHIGLFAEESFNVKFWNRDLDITAGLRYDKVWGMKKGGLAPRINASLELIPEVLSIRGGYGEQFKSPTLGLLYPDKAYFDILNFNNEDTSPSEDQVFQVITTRIFDTKNPNLELARVSKYELGLDLYLGKTRLALTGYYDKSYNGYGFGQTRDSHSVIDYVRYTDQESEYPENTAEIPAISLLDNNKYLAQWTTPVNNGAYEQKGIEAELDFGRIDAIRTSFLLTGAYNYRESWNSGETFFSRREETDPAKYPHVGIFPAKTYSSVSQSMSTNLTVTHNIPRIGFVITLSTNVQWIDHPTYIRRHGNDSIPAFYISRLDGNIRPTDPSLMETDEFYQIFRNRVESQESQGKRDPRYFEKPRNYRPWVTFNINVTKEIGDYLRVSFFANNMFRHYPVRMDERFYEYEMLNKSTESDAWDSYYFGLTLSAKLNFKKR